MYLNLLPLATFMLEGLPAEALSCTLATEIGNPSRKEEGSWTNVVMQRSER